MVVNTQDAIDRLFPAVHNSKPWRGAGCRWPDARQIVGPPGLARPGTLRPGDVFSFTPVGMQWHCIEPLQAIDMPGWRIQIMALEP